MAKPGDIKLQVELVYDEKVVRLLDQIDKKLNRILTNQGEVMADLSALQAEVSENGDAVASAVSLLGSLSQAIKDAGTDPEALAELTSQLDANTNALAEAVVANTPPHATQLPA